MDQVPDSRTAIKQTDMLSHAGKQQRASREAGTVGLHRNGFDLASLLMTLMAPIASSVPFVAADRILVLGFR